MQSSFYPRKLLYAWLQEPLVAAEADRNVCVDYNDSLNCY